MTDAYVLISREDASLHRCPGQTTFTRISIDVGRDGEVGKAGISAMHAFVRERCPGWAGCLKDKEV